MSNPIELENGGVRWEEIHMFETVYFNIGQDCMVSGIKTLGHDPETLDAHFHPIECYIFLPDRVDLHEHYVWIPAETDHCWRQKYRHAIVEVQQ